MLLKQFGTKISKPAEMFDDQGATFSNGFSGL
jgi:hypothetical protein